MSTADNKEPVIYWRCRIEPDCGLQVRSVFFLELNKHLPSPRSTMEDYDILLSISTPATYEAYPTKIEALEAFRRSILSDIEQVRAALGAEPVQPKSYGQNELVAVREEWLRFRALWRPALPADQGSAEA